MRKRSKKRLLCSLISFAIITIIVCEHNFAKEKSVASESSTTETTTAKTATANKVSLIQIGTEDTILYSQSDQASEELEAITRGELATLIAVKSDWYEISTNSGQQGYVTKASSDLIKVAEPTEITTLSKAVIVLDAGHGGDDTGALSNDGFTDEKEITLATATAVKKELEALGSTVIMTRTTDTYHSLAKVTDISIENQADLFISFHYDSTDYPNEGSGTTTYYYYEKYAALAETVNEALANELSLANRGAIFGDFQVLRENTQPALLLELGYMNNDYDFETFSTEAYQNKLATVIVNGIKNYFSN